MTSPPTPGYRTVAYYPNWSIYARKFRPQSIVPERFTHILYAFSNVRGESGEVFMTDLWADVQIHWEKDSWNDTGNNLYGCLKQLNIIKKSNPNLKVMLSIGGWTYSQSFRGEGSVMTEKGRDLFAQSAVTLLKDLGFDGIDIDWEYPKDATEAGSYVKLLAAVRERLDAYSKELETPYHFELSVACPAGASNYEKLDITSMDQYLDFWNLMAYDFSGSWDRVSGHQANLYVRLDAPSTTPFSTTEALNYYTTHGVAPNKIVLGMPLYGRAFDNTDGLGCPFTVPTEGTWENGVFDYKALPLAGAREVYDPVVGTSYCYNSLTRRLVSYDSREAVVAKAKFICEQGLGGAMWWEVTADKDGSESSTQTMMETLGGPQALQQKRNCLTYPQSQYDNLRAGFPDDA